MRDQCPEVMVRWRVQSVCAETNTGKGRDARRCRCSVVVVVSKARRPEILVVS